MIKRVLAAGCALLAAGIAAAGETQPRLQASAREEVWAVSVPGDGTSYARVRVTVPHPGQAARTAQTPSGPLAQDRPSDLVTIEEFQSPPGPEPVAPEKEEPLVLATLYGSPVTRDDVVQELWNRRGKETFEWIVGRELLKRELKRNGLAVTDGEIKKRLDEHLEGLRLAYPNLRRPDDLTRAAAGMPLEEYGERAVWAELALRKIMRVAMKPDEEKLRSYFADIQAEFVRPERVRVSQVFIAPQPPPEADGIAGPEDWRRAERQIMEAHNRLRLGEDFGEVARAYGTGGQTSRWVGRGDLLRELEEAAFGIGVDSVTTPIRTAMGYHILTVEERQERSVPKFDEVRDEVLARFEEEQFVRLAGEFMARMKTNAIKNGGLIIADVPDAFAKP